VRGYSRGETQDVKVSGLSVMYLYPLTGPRRPVPAGSMTARNAGACASIGRHQKAEKALSAATRLPA
jgi:hypothetical protein